MKRFALLVCAVICLPIAEAKDPKLQPDWEAVICNPKTPLWKVRQIREAWFDGIGEKPQGNLTGGELGNLSMVNRLLIAALVKAGRYHEAARMMKAHVDFCEREDAGLYGRYWPTWIGFVQLHARVWAELGYDPLKGRDPYYQLTEDRLGYHALIEQETLDKERNTEMEQITWGDEIPSDETIGECVLMNTIGKMTSHVFVGFAFPSAEPSLGKRVRAIYAITEEKPSFRRVDASGLLSDRR